MRLIGVKTLNDYKLKHTELTSRLDAWAQEVKVASWKTPHNVKARYQTADFFEKNHVVINLKGNKYRLLFQIDYQRATVLVKAIGTHAKYDKWKLK